MGISNYTIMENKRNLPEGLAKALNKESKNKIVSKLKFVLIGDEKVGKTCMLISYTTEKFPDDYVPTIFDSYNVNVTVDGDPLSIGLWDTASQDEYEKLRPISYPNTDVFLLLFDITNTTSFYNVSKKWLKEIRHYNPRTPIILVGTQSDKKYNSNTIKRDDSENLVKENNLQCYVECSALNNSGIKRVFDEAIKVGLT